MVREGYLHLFADDPARKAGAAALAARTYEFVEFLTYVLKVDLRAMGVRWEGAATYHASCHLRALGMTDEATRLMRQVDGLELRPMDNAEQCCGFGGTFASKYPDISGAMVRDKVQGIRASGAGTVVCNDAEHRRGVPARRVRCVVHDRRGDHRRIAESPDAGGRVTPPPIGAEHLLEPALPYAIAARVQRAAADIQLQQFVNTATRNKDRGRSAAFMQVFGDRLGAVRGLAAEIKQHTLDHLDHYLERFIGNATAAGATVHFAKDGAQANAIALEIARANACRLCVKSKSMVTEETRLLPALEAAGVRTVETDLGEFILQLDGDAPSHIVTPMIHKDRTAVARAFVRELGAPYTEDPAQLTLIAREHLRDLYRRADLGISGGNFLVASTGSLVVCTNEGNGDFCVSGPRVHIAMVGIEKLIPGPEHLGVLLKVLARSSTAQPLTVYTTVITGPRRPHEQDGPEQVHIILLDNGRTTLLADGSSGGAREMLRCIRCGACLNACPVYRKVGGGHAYGAVYSGPIGAILTPSLKGLHNYPDLPHASSLCGACGEACPVKIDIPRQLIRLRREMVAAGITGHGQRLALRAWAAVLMRPRLYRLAAGAQRLILRADAAPPGGTRGPYADQRWLADLPAPLSGWTRERDFPTPPSTSFRSWWRSRRYEEGAPHP
jgi:L-lactate dehydrogenase complex protein LldF